MAYDRNHAKLWQDVKADLDKLRARAGKFAADAEWAFGSRTARVLGVLVLFAVVVTLLLVFLNWYVAPTKPSDKKDLVLALAQILAGTALLSGLYFTWRTLQVNREGQITERFTRAIDQLGKAEEEGNKLFEIRLGGIYALERIARESAEDHWPIMEVLTAYVRQHVPWRPEEAQQSEEDAGVEHPGEDSRETTETTEGSPPSPDIQAIMTVLRRRTRFFGHGAPEPLDLRSTHLKEANLYGANLQEANFYGVNLQEANLQEAKLYEAKLRGANLYRADPFHADLREADLQGANLQGANVQGAKLQEANLREANLHGAKLHGAKLRYGNFYEANFQGANFEYADLQGAKLQYANLQGATVTDKQLARTHELQGATMPDGQTLKGSLTPDAPTFKEWLKSQGRGEEEKSE